MCVSPASSFPTAVTQIHTTTVSLLNLSSFTLPFPSHLLTRLSLLDLYDTIGESCCMAMWSSVDRNRNV